MTSGLYTSALSQSCLLAPPASASFSLCVQTGEVSVATLHCTKLRLPMMMISSGGCQKITLTVTMEMDVGSSQTPQG